jgi:hypothetical protein
MPALSPVILLLALEGVGVTTIIALLVAARRGHACPAAANAQTSPMDRPGWDQPTAPVATLAATDPWEGHGFADALLLRELLREVKAMRTPPPARPETARWPIQPSREAGLGRRVIRRNAPPAAAEPPEGPWVELLLTPMKKK